MCHHRSQGLARVRWQLSRPPSDMQIGPYQHRARFLYARKGTPYVVQILEIQIRSDGDHTYGQAEALGSRVRRLAPRLAPVSGE